jgi:DNA-binding LacI/PurR family transcriptional regulator
VSPSIVSVVLNDTDGGRVAEDGRRRIVEAAKRLGYEPNPAGSGGL